MDHLRPSLPRPLTPEPKNSLVRFFNRQQVIGLPSYCFAFKYCTRCFIKPSLGALDGQTANTLINISCTFIDVPAGARHLSHGCVAILEKGKPLPASCVLPWTKWQTLIGSVWTFHYTSFLPPHWCQIYPVPIAEVVRWFRSFLCLQVRTWCDKAPVKFKKLLRF